MTLNCSADGNPRPVISWTRVSDNSAVIFPLTDIGQLDEGAYRCTAYNGVGSVVTRDSSVIVHCESSLHFFDTVRLYKFYTLRKWASLQKIRRVLSALREENNFALPYMYTYMCIWVALAKFH